MTLTNLIRDIKSISPAQNVTIQQNLDHTTTPPKTNTIHPIISLKLFTYKIRNLKKSNYVTERRKIPTIAGNYFGENV